MLARERFAWVWMTSLIGVLGGYFFALRSLDAAALGHAQQIGLLAAALGSLGVIALLTRLLIRDRGEDAGVDERDRLFEGGGGGVQRALLQQDPSALRVCLPEEGLVGLERAQGGRRRLLCTGRRHDHGRLRDAVRRNGLEDRTRCRARHRSRRDCALRHGHCRVSRGLACLTSD